MNNFTAIFNINQFGTSLIYLVLVSAVGIVQELNDVSLARLGQAINIPVSGILMFFSWKYFPNAPALHELEDGRLLLLAGFSQLWETVKGIKCYYGASVGFFFLTVVFAEAGEHIFCVKIFALTSIVVSYPVLTNPLLPCC